MVKANSLIEASYRLELYEQRLILLATTKEKTRRGTPGELEGMITITAAEYAQVYGLDIQTAYNVIAKAASTLMHRQVKIYYDLTGKELIPPLHHTWIITRGELQSAGLIKLKFHPDIEPYLADVKDNFTRYYLEYIGKMSSVHAIHLYELLINWGQNFQIHSKEIALDEIKKLLSGEAKYEEIKSFKKYVLDIACKQINEFTDIECSYENKRTGRTITHIIFFFGRKPGYEKKLTHNAPQLTPKHRLKKDVSPKVEIAPPHEIKAIEPIPANIQLRDQEDWQNLVTVLHLKEPYKELILNSRLISIQENQLNVGIAMGTKILWQTFKKKLEKLLSQCFKQETQIKLITESSI